ncbi:MAG: hypothetical protein AAGG47_03085 [Pseudomonadota bacterium]
MGLGIAIDVSIGLIFMYVVLSLFVTSVNEAIASLFRMRAKTLANEIDRIIDDEETGKAFWQHSLIRALSNGDVVDGDGKKRVSRAPSQITGDVFATALIEAKDTAKKTSKILDALYRTLDDNGDTPSERIATWYESLRGRMAEVYQRKMLEWSFAVAFAVAVAINADTFAVARALWTDEALRTAIATAAEQAAQNDNLEGLAAREALEQALPAFPLGWDLKALPADLMQWAVKFGGFLLTSFAVMLGAPFWFEILSGFVRARSMARDVARRREAGSALHKPNPQSDQ